MAVSLWICRRAVVAWQLKYTGGIRHVHYRYLEQGNVGLVAISAFRRVWSALPPTADVHGGAPVRLLLTQSGHFHSLDLV